MKEVSPEVILEARDLSFSYPNQKSLLLQACSLKLFGSEIFCLLGPSGAGKTTLLKLLAGLLKPTQGSIYYLQKPQESYLLKERKRLAKEITMSFQKGGLLDWLTVEQNIRFALNELNEGSPEQNKELVDMSLERVGLSHFKKRFIRELSGGMLKRLSLARAIALNPKVLLCDDPTAGLDPVTAAEIVKLIQDFQSEKQASVLIVTSDLSVAFALSRRMGFLWSGKVMFEGSPSDFKETQEPSLRQFLFGLQDGPLSEGNHA